MKGRCWSPNGWVVAPEWPAGGGGRRQQQTRPTLASASRQRQLAPAAGALSSTALRLALEQSLHPRPKENKARTAHPIERPDRKRGSGLQARQWQRGERALASRVGAACSLAARLRPGSIEGIKRMCQHQVSGRQPAAAAAAAAPARAAARNPCKPALSRPPLLHLPADWRHEGRAWQQGCPGSSARAAAGRRCAGPGTA